LAVVEVHAGEVETQRGIAGGGPGGVTGQNIDFARLQCGKALDGVQGDIVNGVGIAQYGSGDGTTYVNIETLPFAAIVRRGKTWQAITNATLYGTARARFF